MLPACLTQRSSEVCFEQAFASKLTRLTVVHMIRCGGLNRRVNLSYRTIELVTIDELALMTEEDISDRVSKCRSEMGKRAGDVSWRQAWEVELAYALRELQIRQERRVAHQRYLEQESDRDRQAFIDEDRLPEYEGNRIPKFVKESFGWN